MEEPTPEELKKQSQEETEEREYKLVDATLSVMPPIYRLPGQFLGRDLLERLWTYPLYADVAIEVKKGVFQPVMSLRLATINGKATIVLSSSPGAVSTP